MKRFSDKTSAQRREKSGPGTGRRGGEKAAEKSAPAPVLCGWDLPIIPDDNNLTVWMKREKNGDNKRKKINELYEEEQFRHITEHCDAIENRLLFDRQSLNDRYLKHCQFGVRDLRSNRVTPVSVTPGGYAPRPPSQQSERKCYSANAVADEASMIAEMEEEGEAAEEEEGRLRRMMTLSRGRSRSAISLRAHGMTLPDAHSRPVPGDEVKEEGEDGGWDEGYGSKVSSNDQEHDAAEEDTTKTVDDCGGAPEGGQGAPATKLGTVLNPTQVQILSHQDAMAKLMYSRRERTVYERLPSRRMRGNSFRYAGREQSRLTEASLSHITPTYLARYHHLADMANTAHSKGGKHKTPGTAHNVAEGAGGEGGMNGAQARTLVLRKITIQDSGKELFCQRVAGNTSVAQPTDKVHRRQGLLSPPRPSSDRAVSETKSGVSEGACSGPSVSEQVSVTVQELPPSRHSPTLTVTATPAPSPHTVSVTSMLSVRSAREDWQTATPIVTSSEASPSSEKLSAMNSFAVTDLLPAVERSIRSQRTSQRDMTKSKTVDVSATLTTINNRHHHNLQQQRTRHQRQNQQQYQQAGLRSQRSNGLEGLISDTYPSAGREDTLIIAVAPNASQQTAKGKLIADEVAGYPGFRPHHHITPLQRAKEIANRRIHGHVTQMPDGSETVRVPSPRYASRSDQQSSSRRAKSASRLLGQVMSRYTYVTRNSAV